jgi:hypothetical protein
VGVFAFTGMMGPNSGCSGSLLSKESGRAGYQSCQGSDFAKKLASSVKFHGISPSNLSIGTATDTANDSAGTIRPQEINHDEKGKTYRTA